MNMQTIIDALSLALMSLIFGVLVVLLDYICLKFREISILKISHADTVWKDIPKMLMWGVGSAIVALIGAILQLFNTEGQLQTSLMIAICWPILFNRIFEKVKITETSDPSTVTNGGQ